MTAATCSPSAPLAPPLFCQDFNADAVLTAASGDTVPLRTLPAFLRALLVTDGTVTKMLEAHFWEPIHVVTLRQEFVDTPAALPWLTVPAHEQVLVRHAYLRGATSQVQYAQASSVIRTACIPADFRQRLIDRELGIGTLIRDSGLESYREVMAVGLDTSASTAPLELAHASVFRTYRIIIACEPVILITETFPVAQYR